MREPFLNQTAAAMATSYDHYRLSVPGSWYVCLFQRSRGSNQNLVSRRGRDKQILKQDAGIRSNKTRDGERMNEGGSKSVAANVSNMN